MVKSNIIYQQNKKSGTIYAYEDSPYWDKEKKQSRSKRKLLGKVDPLTGEITPTRGRKPKEEQRPVRGKPAPTTDTVPMIGKVLIFLRLFLCETLAKRVVGIILIVAGLPDSRVAELTGLCDKSVGTLKKKIESGEDDRIFHVVGGGRKGKLDDVEASIIDEVNNGTFHSHQQIADMVQEKYGIKVTLPVISRLLKKTGSSG